MKKKHLACLFLLIQLLASEQTLPCSMFKITLYGKTMVGNNEDAWRVNSCIWFETGRQGHYGAAYVGHNDGFPQGGMNEAGLVFDGFAVYPRTLHPQTGRMKTGAAGDFLKGILQKCATVEQVRDYVNRYDRSIFNNSMLLFVDKAGNYLVVEVDTTIIGLNATYVLSNFCPSLTPDPSQVTIGRYRRGIAFLQHQEDTSLSFCRAMMDTMHECRKRLGDGTTYTSIYDLNAGLINLYFYHDYGHTTSFNLQQELAKGDHSFLMSSLFPPNAEYIRYLGFKTPFNNPILNIALQALRLGLLLTLLCLLLLTRSASLKIRLPLGLLNLGLIYYISNLLSNKAIFYFDAPYSEDGKFLLNLSSYFPLTLLLLFIPLIVMTVRTLRSGHWGRSGKTILTTNIFCYGFLLLLFAYWGLYV
ncbi:hypothetical protein Q4E93_19345 [Flavitalea sp. BT771]|uniref:hypothetical protein n=1 Tax=Flavitalea sp. BT771 TaxID=3063329 RepID=UPI0026E383D6|nr:hypothetical protein [Flavitalea sp. BT771]MDO6432771.1 hypothetical protein [Flavitalea sp. BT771]MDV6221953.1 hypothetical protein [Flavitalea sp. BT771]